VLKETYFYWHEFASICINWHQSASIGINWYCIFLYMRFIMYENIHGKHR